MPARSIEGVIFGSKKKVIAAANPLIGLNSNKGADTSISVSPPAGNAGDQLLLFSMSATAHTGYTAVNASGSFGMNIDLHYKSSASGSEGAETIDNGGL